MQLATAAATPSKLLHRRHQEDIAALTKDSLLALLDAAFRHDIETFKVGLIGMPRQITASVQLPAQWLLLRRVCCAKLHLLQPDLLGTALPCPVLTLPQPLFDTAMLSHDPNLP